MAGKPPEVKILGDASGAKKAAKETEDALKGVGDSADQADDKIDRFGKSADTTRTKVADLGEDLKNRLGPAGEFAGGTIDKVTGAIGKMPPAALAAGGGVAALAAGLAALAVSSVNELSDLVNDMEMLRSKSGMTLEEVSRLSFAMERVGVSTDDLDEVMEEWGQGLEENVPKLEAMGVAIARNADGTVNSDKTFRNFLSTLRGVEDPARRLALAQQLIGESAYRIEPALRASEEAFNDFYEAADEAGAVVNDLDAQTVRELENATKDLKQAWTTVQLTVARAVGPAFADFMQTVAALAQKIADLESKTGILSASMKVVTAPLAAVSAGLDAVGIGGDDASESLEGVTEATDDAGAAAQARAADLAAEEAAERAATDAINERTDAARRAMDQTYALSAASRDVTQAQIDEKEAQDDLTAAINEHGPASTQATEASLRLQAASDKVEQAYIKQAQAQTDLTASQRIAAGQTVDNATKNDIFVANLTNLANSLAEGSPVRQALYGHIAALQAVPGYVSSTVAVNFTAQGDAAARIAVGKGLLGLAKGGTARAGEPVIVGEEGPEVFVPGQTGTVVPNGKAFGGGGTPLSAAAATAAQPIVVKVMIDKREVGRAVVDDLRSRG